LPEVPHAEVVAPLWQAPLASQHPEQVDAEHRPPVPHDDATDVNRPNTAPSTSQRIVIM
jgi:hypothetical protein